MKPATLIKRTVFLLAGIGVILLLLEGLLRVLPVIEGTYAADPRAGWPVHTMIPDSRYTYSSGWNLANVHRGRINNYGYASPHDYQPGRGDIAVFGDSYVESLMNDYRDSLAGVLEDSLQPRREVLSFGMAGAEMPDYLGTAPLVRAEFSPDWAVFLITAGDFTRGFNASPGYFEWDVRQSPPIRLIPEIRRSSLSKVSRTMGLVRYLRGNLSLRPGELIQWRQGADHAAGTRECRDEVLSSDDQRLLTAFIQGLPQALELPTARIVVVFDADRRSIYAGAKVGAAACQTREQLSRDYLLASARATGMHVIDAEPLFREHFAAGRGPLDRSPLDAHWNPAAHRLVAREIARVIQP